MKAWVVTTAMIAAALAAVLACGLSQPSVENDKYKNPQFDHTGVTSGCAACHESTRPASPHPQGTDCSSCHAYPQWKPLSTPFTHQPKPESCAFCHEKDRSQKEGHPSSGDCVSCHNFPSWPPKT